MVGCGSGVMRLRTQTQLFSLSPLIDRVANVVMMSVLERDLVFAPSVCVQHSRFPQFVRGGPPAPSFVYGMVL